MENNTNQKAKKRDVNIELLRIVSILMVTTIHCIDNGLIMQNANNLHDFRKKPTKNSLKISILIIEIVIHPTVEEQLHLCQRLTDTFFLLLYGFNLLGKLLLKSKRG